MKICIVSGPISDSWDQSFELDQAIALNEYGHEVYIVSIDLRSLRKKRKHGITQSNYQGINVIRCSLPFGPIFPKIRHEIGAKLFGYVYKKLKRRNIVFDVVHAHFVWNAYIASKTMAKETIPFIITEHSSTVHKPLEQMNSKDIYMAKYSYAKADRIIAVSESLSKSIKSNFGYDSVIVYNVIDEENFYYIEKDNKKNNEKFTFVSAGHLNDNKRMDLLIKSFAKAFSNNKKIMLKIFGEGPNRKKLESIIHDLEIGEQVFLMGNRPRRMLSEAYDDADCFVLLSKHETFGVSYIEAMKKGLPVIACKSGGPEAFIYEDVGMITDDDIDKVAEAMIYMEENIDKFSCNKISSYVDNMCSRRVIAERLTEIYSNCINEYIITD